ncbi:MAG: hypothetical protein U0931_10965 [Vulcanimicrobiota bacterium]
MRKKAFTLVELAIVLCLMTVVSTAMAGLLRVSLRQQAQSVQQTDRVQDCRRVAWRIFNASRSGARILPGQNGLKLRDGGEILFQAGVLRLRGRPMLSEKLRDFVVIRRQNKLHLLFEFENSHLQFAQPEAEPL